MESIESALNDIYEEQDIFASQEDLEMVVP